MNVIDSFLIALGFKVDASGIEDAKRKTEAARDSIISMGSALTGLVAGLAVHKVAEIGSAFEQNRISIAGFLSALGLAGDFNDGLREAAEVMKKITTDAAKLPGEAEDYIEVFKTNAAFLKNGMPGANAKQISEFTNRLTAVAKTVDAKMDAGQIARESAMLLGVEGRAGSHNVLWQRLLPFLMQVEGHAKITAQEFNAMTQPKRVELLNAAFAKLQPALDASANSFDAMWGAMVSGVRQLTRLGTEGLFKGMKKGLEDLNATFFDTDGNLTQTGKDVVAVIAGVGSAVATLLVDAGQLVAMLAKLTQHSTLFKVALVALSAVIAGAAFDKGLTSLIKFATGFKRATFLTGLFAIALFLIAEDIWGFFHGAQSLTGMLVDKLGPGIVVVAIAVGALASAFLALKVQALAAAIGVNAAFLPLMVWIFALGLVAIAIYMVMQHWDELVLKLEAGANYIIDILNKVIDKINEVVQAFGFKGFGHIEHQLLLAKDPQALQNFQTPEHFRKLGEADDESAIPAWLTPTKGGGHATSSTPVVHHGDMNVDIKIDGAKDPRETGREVQRAIRTSQTRIKR